VSVYRPKDRAGKAKSPYWHFDFVLTIAGERRRFHGSTGETAKARAQEAERRERARLRDGKPNDAMTLAEACARYCDEVSADQPSADDTEKSLEHCCRLIGGGRRLVNVTADDIALAVRKRAAETYGTKHPKIVSKATVNRQIVQPMNRVLRRARKVWGVSCDSDSIPWRALILPEPKERVREFSAAEADAFWPALRQDYIPLIWFLGHRGLRVRAAIGMRKKHVDLAGRRIQVWRKGVGLEWRPITAEQGAVLQTEMARAPGDAVWCYELQRGKERGRRRPISYSGLRRVIESTLAAAGIVDFRLHDLRHDFASKLLRATGDLALVKKAMQHADIASTMRYAHILDEDISEGMEAMSRNSTGGTPRVRARKGAK